MAGRRSVRCILVVAAVLAATCPSSLGTTWRTVTVSCPLCQTEVTARVPGSTFIPRRTPDLRPLGVGVDSFVAGIAMCPTCGFATHVNRFERPEGLDQGKVKAALKDVKSPRLFQTLDRAIAVEKQWTNNLPAIAHLELGAKWLADDTGEVAVIQERLRRTIDAQVLVLDQDTLPDDQRQLITYLVGELHRQAGHRDQAVEWLTRAAQVPAERPRVMAEQRLFLARHAGASPKAILEAGRSAGDGGRLAAVSLLREADSPEAVAFVKEVLLNCPEPLREDAMHALIGDTEPRRHHLPIFLEGLRSTHYRTVQGSAVGVEILRAVEAAPILAEALLNPVQATEYRLLAALGAVATESQLDFLKTQIERRTHADEVLKGLLNTRSSKAVPYILQMARKGPGRVTYADQDLLTSAEAFGPALMRALPNLKSAPKDDALAIFKARVLAVCQAEGGEDELTAALSRDDRVALEAALALARRGSAAGKPLLLKHLDRVRTRDRRSIALVYPLLDEADYAPLLEMMQSSKAEEKETLERLRSDAEQSLKDPELSQDLRGLYRRNLERYEWNEDRFMAGWLVILAATGNIDARPLCLKYIESADPMVRCAAAQALGQVFDRSVGDALVQQLGDEHPGVQAESIRSLGRGGHRRYVADLLNVIREPTLVHTKLAWIEAMVSLAPDKAQGILTEWARSPSRMLSEAAQKALDGESSSDRTE